MRDDYDLDRRTFLRASGLTAAGLALGADAAAAAAEGDGDFAAEYANWRVREARKVWERGYRGRRDRPVALTDSGVDALHPDLGPWNGVRVEDTADSFQLVEDTFVALEDAAVDETRTLPPGSATRAEVADVPVPKQADRVRVGAVDAGLEENGILYIEDADGETIDSNDGLLADYVGVASAVSRDETETVTVALVADTSTGADVDFHVRFYENTAGKGQQKTTQLKPIGGEDGTQETSGSIGPSITGPAAQDVRVPLEHTNATDRVEAALTFEPQPQDLDFYLEDGEGNEVASSGNAPGANESLSAAIDGSKEYELVIHGFAVVQADYEVTAEFFREVETSAAATDGPNRARKVIDDVDSVTDTDDKTIGWYGTKRYGEFAEPLDGNGHGTHVSSIMAGTGQASAVENVETDAPHAVLLPGDVVEYTVDAAAGTGVFATAYGTALDVRIEDPEGETVAHSQLFGGGPHGYDSSIQDSNIASSPTTHDADAPFADDEGRAPYTVYVTPSKETTSSTPLVAELDHVAVGSFVDPDATDGDQDDEAGVDTVHAGVAPDAGIVGVQGLGDGLAALAKDPDWWAETFGVRAVNMSWGTVGGLPFGSFGGALNGAVFGDNDTEQLKWIAEGGILTVAAAGNSYTPANGNSAPAVADEAISVASTGPLDGLSAFSSGGAPALDEDDEGTYAKPDVTAPGGRAPLYPASLAFPVYDDVFAAKNGVPEVDGERRGYTGKIGTSMASPYVNGVAGLVAEAMDETYGDAPDAIALPEPADTGLDDVMRLKQVLLATASETAFTAAPYHEAKTVPHAPTYGFGDRDPYEGFGRVNPDAAVDAVTRELTGTTEGVVGLNLPEDSRAVAGYVEGAGAFTVDLSVSHLSGGNRGMAKGSPWLDLFVYDAEEPAAHGDPAVVARSQAPQGSTSLSFEGDGVYYVVAKLVNVPGVVNGYDVQAHFDLTVSHQAAPAVTSAGRSDGATVYTGGQTSRQTVRLDADEPVYVRDTVPPGWEVVGGDYHHLEDADDESTPTTVVFEAPDGGGTTALEATYFAEAPEGAENTGTGTFGPIEAKTDVTDWIALADTTEQNVVAGPSTNV